MNRLLSTTQGEDETIYSYDNAGNRFIKQSPEGTTIYLRHGQIAVAMDIELPVDTTEEWGRVNRYVLSGDLLAGRITTTYNSDTTVTVEKSYYHLDHLNSTKCVTDDTADGGELEVMYEYRAFGEQLKRLDANGEDTDDKAKYSYSGKELDDGTNLYYFNARYYDATIGRFINVDPIQDGMNWYVYCGNNPLCFIDPTGLGEEDIVEDFDVTGTGPGNESAEFTPAPTSSPTYQTTNRTTTTTTSTNDNLGIDTTTPTPTPTPRTEVTISPTPKNLSIFEIAHNIAEESDLPHGEIDPIRAPVIGSVVNTGLFVFTGYEMAGAFGLTSKVGQLVVGGAAYGVSDQIPNKPLFISSFLNIKVLNFKKVNALLSKKIINSLRVLIKL